MPPIFYNGIECNDVYFNGVKTTGFLNGNQIWGSESKPIYTLTLQTDGHGTLNANALTGYAGDTVTLTTAYNTYYRFNNYGVTGGSVAGNVFTFGSADATVKANFKVNSFTASGRFINTNTVVNSASGSVNSGIFYAIVGSKSTNVPASYLTNVTSIFYAGTTAKKSVANASGWKPPSNVSAYHVSGYVFASLSNSQERNILAKSDIKSNNVSIGSFSSKRSGSVSSNGSFVKSNASPGLLSWVLSSSGYYNRINVFSQPYPTFNIPNGSPWSASGIAP